MNYRINNLYPFHVWLLTILTAPIIIGVSLVEWKIMDMEETTRTISFIGAGILFGGGLSLPTLVVHYLSFFLVTSMNIRESAMKTVLALVAITGFIVTFYVIGLDILEFTTRDMVLPLSYFIGIVGFSSLFRIKKPVKQETLSGSETERTTEGEVHTELTSSQG
jgi:hypothetical protein